MPGYESICAGVRKYLCRGRVYELCTKVLVPVIGAGVRGYYCQGMRVIVPGYEGISAGLRGY